jgi:hypothetical protein
MLAQVIADPFDEGGAHVATDPLYLGLWDSFVGGQVQGEGPHGVCIFARGGEHDPALGQVHEQRDVVVPPLGRGLVTADIGDPRKVQLGPRCVHVVLDDPPDAGVVLTGHLGQRSYRHLLGKGEHRHLHEEREAAPGPGPRNGDEMDTVGGAVDSRHPSRQEGLVFEEVEMAPPLLHRVVHRARPVGAALLGAGEACATREVQPDAQLTSRLVELNRGHLPWRRQSQRCSEHHEQALVLHGIRLSFERSG